jgi:hypothetical protein
VDLAEADRALRTRERAAEQRTNTEHAEKQHSAAHDLHP